ncbi:MAG: hypothetical protein AAF065_06060 [Verrucomicrobiota bacterium]
MAGALEVFDQEILACMGTHEEAALFESLSEPNARTRQTFKSEM